MFALFAGALDPGFVVMDNSTWPPSALVVTEYLWSQIPYSIWNGHNSIEHARNNSRFHHNINEPWSTENCTQRSGPVVQNGA